MAACDAFCAASEVTRPRPLAAGFFADVLFLAVPLLEALLFAALFFAEGADFVLVALGPLASVLAALVRAADVVPLVASVFAALVLAGLLGADFAADFFAVLFFAAGADLVLEARGPLASVFAALLRAEALLLFLASVFAAVDFVDLLVGISVFTPIVLF